MRQWVILVGDVHIFYLSLRVVSVTGSSPATARPDPADEPSIRGTRESPLAIEMG